MFPQQLSILGVGLLGGSIGLAVRSQLNDCKIIGYGHRAQTLMTAVEAGVIDEAQSDLVKSVADSDLVILCTPVGMFGDILRKIAGHLKDGCIVTDVGSTKRSVVEQAEKLLPKTVKFVGSHPMAGSEKRGVEFARADLFRHALCILTPTDRTDAGALQKVDEFWKTLGMRTTELSPGEHDRLLADVSHLPHVVAAALVAMQTEGGLELAGKGFLDSTRIAGGDGGLWRDILLDNSDEVRTGLKHLIEKLQAVMQMLDGKQGEELKAWLNQNAGKREELARKKLREIDPD